MNRLDHLLAAWDQGTLSAEELLELKLHLQTREGRAELVDYWAVNECIHTALSVAQAEATEVEKPRALAPSFSRQKAPRHRRFPFPKLVWHELRITWTWPFWGAAALGLILLSIQLYFEWIPACTATTQAQGQATVQRHSRTIPLTGSMALYPGDQLRVAGSSSTRLTWGGTSIEVNPGTDIEILNPVRGKRLAVAVGHLIASVSSQPRLRPLRIKTPSAEVRVVGTRFALNVTPDTTRLEVMHGAVRLMKTISMLAGEPSDIVVQEGQLAVAAPGVTLVARPLTGFLSQDFWIAPSQPELSTASRTGVAWPGSSIPSPGQGSNVVARMRGYLLAPQAGKYTFWIATLNGESGAELWLSPDDNPSKKERIARLTGRTDTTKPTQVPTNLTAARSMDWKREPGQKSAPRILREGARYYLEVWASTPRVEALAIGWHTPVDSDTGPPRMIDPQALAPFTGVDALDDQPGGRP